VCCAAALSLARVRLVLVAIAMANAAETLSDLDRNLVVAVDQNDVEAAQQAIRNGAIVNCRVHRHGIFSIQTPLIMACQHLGNAVIVRMLLDAGANARWKDGYGLSAIAHACQNGHLSIVEALLNHDKDLLEIEDNVGRTTSFMAIYTPRSSRRHVDIVRFLLNRGANLQATSSTGMTMLMAAAQMNRRDIMRLLLDAHVDVESRDHTQQTALHYAACNNQFCVEAVRVLTEERNADILAVDKNGCTPFDAGDGYESLVKRITVGNIGGYFLQLYGNNMTRDHGRLAPHAILRSAEYSCVADGDYWHPPLLPLRIRLPLGTLAPAHFRALLHYLNTELIRNPDDSGKLPIHVACETNAPAEVLALLVEMDSATLLIADHTGSLPLHLLCCNGTTMPTKYASVRHLVEQGSICTLSARNHKGALPLHNLVASTNPTLRTVQYLIQSFPGAVTARTADAGLYPFMVAACDTSSASLSVIYELVRANPSLVVPR
jgi:uncharacterized protein